MDENCYPNLNEICRLCLKEYKDLLNIYNSEISIPFRIMACTSLEVKESDNLPSNICKYCRISLERFYLFRKKCQSADIKLRRHTKQINAGKVSKVFSQRYDEDEDDDLIISEGFIEAYEEEEKYMEKIKNINKFSDKKTQTEADTIKNEFVLLNYKNQIPTEDFIFNQCSNNGSPDNCTISLKKESSHRTQPESGINDESSDIIYVIEKESSEVEDESDEVDENVQNRLEIYMNGDDESLQNDKNATVEYHACDDIDNSSDVIRLIETSSLLDENSEKMNDIDDTNSKHEMDADVSKDILDCSGFDNQEQELSDSGGRGFLVKHFKCHLCPQAFSRVILLEKHLNLHKKDRTYVCSVCKKHFTAKSTLDRHSRIHNGEKPYKCDVCGKAFIQKEILKRHRYLHFDKKPYPCSHCNQAFIQKNLLEQHITIKHSGKPIPKLYSCDICPKAFVFSSGLSRHLVLHSGIQYSCKVCFRKFNDKSAMKRHEDTHVKTKS